METFLHPSSEDVRISSSPRRSPQITEGLGSPVKSVHPPMQQMDSMYSQPDHGLRTADFFDDTSDEDSAKAVSAREVAPDENLLPGHRTTSKKRHSVPLDESIGSQGGNSAIAAGRPSHDGYLPLSASAAPADTNRVGTSSSSLVGSVDELLPGERSSPPRFPQRPARSSLRVKRNTINTESSVDRTSKIGQTLGAYAIAHDITLQALLRDESALDRSLHSLPLAPYQASDRRSVLPELGHHGDDPRSPCQRPVSSVPTEGKRVHLVPPLINTSAPRGSLPEDIVRTPYPFSPDSTHGANIDCNEGRTSTTESILSVSIRRSNPNSRRRVTSLTIPASNDFSVVRSHSPRTKEQHFRALDFDDAVLFQQLRKCYCEMMGPLRILSARSLRRITVNGFAMKEVDREYWLSPPRSPHPSASKNLAGTFSEERMMQYYRKPTLGKSRYAFVHWAHRLAAAPSPRTPRPDEGAANDAGGDVAHRMTQIEGLEFVVCWSAARILFALFLVLLTSTAATLLWIFLGHVTVARSHAQGGYHDAGDRVTSGVTMGICLLLFGLSIVAGWLGLSWLVM